MPPLLAIALLAALLVGSTAVAAPPNDECAAATIIKSLPFTHTVTVDGVTESDDDPPSECANDPNVWFRYTARADVSLAFDTTGSTYATNIAVFRGSACGASTEIACTRSVPDAGPQLVVALRRGETVAVAVAGNPNPGDQLTLTVRKSDPRYRSPGPLTELLRSSDPSPYGGSQGLVLGAVAESEKSTAFAQYTSAILLDVAGVTTTIAYSGAPAPGGGTFAGFGAPAVTATDVYFFATIDGGPVPEGFFRWNGTALTAHLLPGDPGPAGTPIRDFRNTFAMGASGTMVFIGRTVGRTAYDLMRFDGTTVTVVAARGDATSCGATTIRDFDGMAIDDAGTSVVFVADLTGPGPDSGVFTAGAAPLQAIACEDAVTPLGGTYRSFFRSPAITALGGIYFGSTYDDGRTRDALWVHAAGITTAVAARGMVLATGETISRLRPTHRFAVDPLGNVVFVADLVGAGRALVRRAHGAPLPSAYVTRADACPLGGLFVERGDDLALAANGTLVFPAACDGGRGTFRKAGDAPATAVMSTTTPTAVGTGVRIATPDIDDTGTRVVARGGRVTLQRLRCDAKGCDAPTGTVTEGAPIANAAGQSLDQLDYETLAGDGSTLAFFGTIGGVANREAVLAYTAGALRTVAEEGQALPGGVGTFTIFRGGGLFSSYLDVGVGKDIVAFAALIDHPTAYAGVFAATKSGLATLALSGDPGPGGEAFIDFDGPVVRGRSVIFVAETLEKTCVVGVKAPGKPLATLVCTGDALPPPFDWTISEIRSTPSGRYDDFYVVATTEGEGPSGCLFRVRDGDARPVRCAGDAFPGGNVYDDLIGGSPAGGPTTDPGVKGVAFWATENAALRTTLMALRRDTLIPVLTLGGTPAPESGGVIVGGNDDDQGFTGKSVVAALEIFGGSATSALVRTTLP